MAVIDLRPGQVIEIEYMKSPAEAYQFRTLVEERKGDEQFLLLAPMYKGMPYPFRDDEPMDVVYTVHDEENHIQVYSFKARLKERIRRGDLSYIRVVRTSEPSKKQRRGFYRLNHVMDALMLVPKEEEVEEYSILTRDVSAGGVRGIVTKYLPSGTMLRFLLDIGPEVMEIPARVVGCDRIEDSIVKNEVRLKFQSLSRTDTAKLIQFINRLQSEYIRRMAAASLEERLALYGHGDFLFTERRLSKDWVLTCLDWSVVASWGLTFLILVNFLLAAPEKQDTIEHYYGSPVRIFWDIDRIFSNIYLILALFVVTSVSLVLNSFRMKRSDDHYRYSLIITGILSLVMLAVYLILL